jgi:hypothetical protein
VFFISFLNYMLSCKSIGQNLQYINLFDSSSNLPYPFAIWRDAFGEPRQTPIALIQGIRCEKMEMRERFGKRANSGRRLPGTAKLGRWSRRERVGDGREWQIANLKEKLESNKRRISTRKWHFLSPEIKNAYV